ncbi:MAG: 4-(cytidine 5'-diphospho)-2-C-methyl-D-erythritol kinase, partial [Rhodoferax sp.]|nr:4-(cytidine 5'-diphospho)-2-C-methyl-D-erythritol kinase [Rhodoferax sp.]
PGCAVATREIFTDPELTRDTPRIRMHDLSAVGYRNDCEPVVRRLYPAVDQALEWLARFGQACLTGTGACVYSLFDSRADAQRVAQQIPAQWSGFLARASNRSALYADAELAAGQ